MTSRMLLLSLLMQTNSQRPDTPPQASRAAGSSHKSFLAATCGCAQVQVKMLVPVDMICGPACESMAGCLICNPKADDHVQGSSGEEERLHVLRQLQAASHDVLW